MSEKVNNSLTKSQCEGKTEQIDLRPEDFNDLIYRA